MENLQFKSLGSFSKEEVKEAIMSQVNFLSAIGFKVIRTDALQFRCSMEGKTVVFNDRKVRLEGVDPEDVTIDLMYHGSERFRKILVAFEYYHKYSESREPIKMVFPHKSVKNPIDEMIVPDGMEKAFDPDTNSIVFQPKRSPVVEKEIEPGISEVVLLPQNQDVVKTEQLKEVLEKRDNHLKEPAPDPVHLCDVCKKKPFRYHRNGLNLCINCL